MPRSNRGRSKSRRRSVLVSHREAHQDSHSDDISEREAESGSLGGPLTLLVSKDRDRRKSRDYKTEIRELENEKKALVSKRERPREPEYEVVEHRDRGGDREILQVNKDSRGRLKLASSS